MGPTCTPQIVLTLVLAVAACTQAGEDIPELDTTEAVQAGVPRSRVAEVDAVPVAAVPEPPLDRDAKSVGRPDDGSIEDATQLPEDPGYTLVSSFVWGSGYAVQQLRAAIGAFRRDARYDGRVVIADLSKKGGGQFAPHASHQSGRDADIWLLAREGVELEAAPGGTRKWRRPIGAEIDWVATWGLVHALVGTGAVEQVMLDWDRQKFLYDAARGVGASEEELAAMIQFPRLKSSAEGVVTHSAEHYTHMHVRFRCAQWEPGCVAEDGGTRE